MKAAVRAGALKALNSGRGSIGAAESHAKRLDPVAQRRRIRETDPLAWSKADDAMAYVDAFKAHKRETGAGERANSALAMELKVIVSPEWLAETGDPRAASNPRVQQLYKNAREWAESWGGDGSVWGLRYDTDERGSGVVDVFMSPVREQKHKGGKTKAVISCRKAKQKLLEVEKAIDSSITTSGAAMQSSWARWCQEKLDARLERGTPKTETQTEHVHAEVYAKTAEAAKSVFEAHLFPDETMELRPPTIEEEIALKRARIAIEKTAKAEARRMADEISRNAREEADNARKAKEEAQKILQEMERMKSDLALELQAAETAKHAVLTQRNEIDREIKIEIEKAKKAFFKEQNNIDNALHSIIQSTRIIRRETPEQLYSVWAENVKRLHPPWKLCSEAEFYHLYEVVLTPPYPRVHTHLGIEDWFLKYMKPNYLLHSRGNGFQERLKVLWSVLGGLSSYFSDVFRNIRKAVFDGAQTPEQMHGHLKNYAVLSDPSFLFKEALLYADRLYGCCHGRDYALTRKIPLSKAQIELIEMRVHQSEEDRSLFHAHLTLACFSRTIDGLEGPREDTQLALKEYVKTRRASLQMKRDLGLSSPLNSGPSF